jgi:predicted CoA-binding protein
MSPDASNPTVDDLDDVIRHRLQTSLTIATVGLSPTTERPSYVVASYLQAQGFRIMPVNPNAGEIVGERCFARVSAVGDPIDLVKVFRNSSECLEIARQAVAVGAKALWFQPGEVGAEAAQIARARRLTVVMDRCTRIEHAQLFGPKL